MDRNEKQVLKFPAPADEPGSIWDQVGLPKPEYQEGGPPVDREALQALVEKRLPAEEVREIYRLTFRFRAWADALADLDLANLKRDLNGEKA